MFHAPLVAQAPQGRFRRANPEDRVPDQYIVLLQGTLSPEAVPALAEELASARGGRVRVHLQYAVRGFTADLSEVEAIRLSQDPRVLLVEENSKVYLSSEQILPADNSLWALDRIDQRTSISGGDDRYRYCEGAGGVIAYVLDTGINKLHKEFGTRVLNGVKFAADHHAWPGEADDYGTWPCGEWVDNIAAGHGTSVASIIGGKTVGVAKSVQLVPLRAFRCIPEINGGGIGLATVEHLCWALDWIRSPSNANRDHRPALVNISLRIPVPLDPDETPDLEGAFEAIINGVVLDSPGWTGITVVASANNQASNAPCSTPARMAYRNTGFVTPGRVISVGGISENDARWTAGLPGNPEYFEEAAPCGGSFPGEMVGAASNYGPLVDIYAPGHNIASAHISCVTCRRVLANSMSGTSFSAAVVSGVVARLLQANPTLTPTQVWSQLQTDATHLGFDIDPDPGVFNDMVVYRAGSAVCSPEYP